jgi:hypothetical protein
VTVRFCWLWLFLWVGACSRRLTTPIPSSAPSDSSYLDLTPGSTLRILIPLWKAGQARNGFGPAQVKGNTIALSANNLLGYEFAYYSVIGRRNGRVQLKFASVEVSKDGQRVPQATAPALPFTLPQKSGFIRLVFLVRVSQSDHNMAIVAAGSRSALDSITRLLKQDPTACQRSKTIFCTSVPEDIAVRPELPGDFKQ